MQTSYPGVYVQELPSSVHTIIGVPTSIAAFVGFPALGPANEAVQIFGWSDYERVFGGLDGSELSYAVYSYYQNGGGEAYAVRAISPGDIKAVAAFAAASTQKPAPAPPAKAPPPPPPPSGPPPTTRPGPLAMPAVWAASPGLWGNNVYVYVDPVPAPSAAVGQFAFRAYQAVKGGNGVYTAVGRGVKLSGVTLVKGPNFVSDQLANLDTPLVAFSDPMNPDSDATDNAVPDVTGTLGVLFDPTKATTTQAKTLTVSASGGIAPPLPKSEVTLPAFADGHAGAAALAAHLGGDPVFGKYQPQVQVIKGPNGQIQLRVILNAFGGAGLVLQFSGDPATALGLTGGSANVQAYRLQQGSDPADLSGETLLGDQLDRTGVYALDTVDIFNLLCLPDLRTLSGGDHLMAAGGAAEYCQRRRAVFICDLPQGNVTLANAQVWAMTGAPDLGNAYTSYAAAYWPEPIIPDPLKNGLPRQVAVSGFMAGIYGQTDNSRGVWKAPAGIAASLSGAEDLAYVMNDAQNGTINPLGLNAMRKFPVYGIVPWGARTLQGADEEASQWKYIPVRRTALYIEESLYRGLKWAVFEPNAAPLWSSIRLNVTAFLQNMFTQGAFAGTSPKSAYFVSCDATTTTPYDIDAGIVNVIVGFAPLEPAEFVILSIQQMAQPGS
jgi:phage tail sheath protein FI